MGSPKLTSYMATWLRRSPPGVSLAPTPSRSATVAALLKRGLVERSKRGYRITAAGLDVVAELEKADG